MAVQDAWLKKRVEDPDEVREFPNKSGSLKLIDLGAEALGYITYGVGWKWSLDMKPAAGTDSCQATHNFYVMSGRMAIVPADGEQFEVGPGDVVYVAPGHDAWTVGDEPCVCLDWTAARKYAS
jgi:mannose-6-phosphate isomerase-like protein (cupin superfamily)